jgi:hypothetical protein
MKTKILTINVILLTLFIFSGCENNKVTTSRLKGTWVEIDTKTDTIIFKTDDLSGKFYLNRGFEMTNGYYLPKIGSGMYSYDISDCSIKIVDLLSSTAGGNNYYFSINHDNESFQIGMFTFFETNKAILTYKRLK